MREAQEDKKNFALVGRLTALGAALINHAKNIDDFTVSSTLIVSSFRCSLMCLIRRQSSLMCSQALAEDLSQQQTTVPFRQNLDKIKTPKNES